VLVRALRSAFMPSRIVPETGDVAHLWHIAAELRQVQNAPAPVATSEVVLTITLTTRETLSTHIWGLSALTARAVSNVLTFQ